MLLDVTDRRIVIVGGGGVAARKASGLIAAGARDICVVAPEFHPEIPVQVKRVAERYRPEHLEGAGLVFAATDLAEVNGAVVRDAHERGLLVCRADSDEQEPGDFSTPALIRRGAITITVSAGGSPALAAAIRDAVNSHLEAKWEKMADAMQQLRPVILNAPGLDGAARQRIFRELAGAEAVEVLDAGGLEVLRAWLKKRFPGLSYV